MRSLISQSIVLTHAGRSTVRSGKPGHIIPVMFIHF